MGLALTLRPVRSVARFNAMPVTDSVHTPDLELARALDRGLTAPLRAVRTALAHLASELDETSRARLDAPRSVLSSALHEAEAAVELLSKRPLHGDVCTVRELAWSARAALPAGARERVWVATEPGGVPLEIDGPTFSRALATILARAIAGSEGEVLLHGHQEDGLTTFAVVDDLTADGDPLSDPTATEPTPESLLANSNLTRLGAEVLEHAAGPHHCTTVRISGRSA